MACGAREARPSRNDPNQRKERLVKRHELRTPIALIVLAALAVGGGWLEQATQPAAAVVPGANGRIAFQSDRDGDSEIYTMSSQGELGKRGQKAKKLTNNGAGDFTPAWSPDGKRIAFSALNETITSGQVFSMAADGANRRRLTKGSAFSIVPDWQAKP